MTIPGAGSRTPPYVKGVDPVIQDPAARRGAQDRPQLRRYEVAALLPDGDIARTSHIAPAQPLFENAFCAFTRGTLITTPAGPVAIEDLLPGDAILTASGDSHPLLWKGSTTLVPGRPGPQGRDMHLTRILADSFGMQRPLCCVLAGPSARLCMVPTHLRGLANGQTMLTPVREFIDGHTVIETAPPTPVDLFHLCLARHAVIQVSGLEFETYHPGPNAGRFMSHAMRSVFLNLFAHVDQISGFGPLAHPRIEDDDTDRLIA